MRDIAVTLIVFGVLPYILVRPHIGVYMWSWIGYMAPHRLGWGFASTLPFAALIGVATLAALLFSKEPKRIPLTSITVTLILFLVWMVITTLFATNPDEAMAKLSKVLKIQLMIFLTLMLFNNRERIHGLVWVIVISLGFYGVKGGIFTLLTGGQFHVVGPPGSFIVGNTSLALALVMVFPLMRYLQMQTDNKWIKRGLIAAMGLSALSILGSYSRGGVLAILAMGGFMLLKSKKRGLMIVMLVLSIPVAVAFMPDRWMGRMQTVQNYEEDSSAMGRITAWMFAIEMAKGRFLGGGFESFTPVNYHLYAPEVVDLLLEKADGRYQGAHSSYFSVLGEHGFVGLFLFLTLGFVSWRTGSWVTKYAADSDSLSWAKELAGMIQVSLVGFAVGGAFLSLAYFDLLYHLMALLVLLKLQVSQSLAEGNTNGQLKRSQNNREMSIQRKGGY